MSGNRESARAGDSAGASIGRNVRLDEGASIGGLFTAQLTGPVEAFRAEYVALRDRAAAIRRRLFTRLVLGWYARRLDRQRAAIPLELKWSERFQNLVVTEGRNALLTHGLKGSAYTASQVLGLIEDTGYSAVAAGNTAANITAVGGASPANGWNEAPVGTCAARQVPSFGTASGGSLAASAAAFPILATDTIKGAFLLCRSTAGTAPTTAVGNTQGALYSAGLFTGGDRAVANGDTLNVTYTAQLT